MCWIKLKLNEFKNVKYVCEDCQNTSTNIIMKKMDLILMKLNNENSEEAIGKFNDVMSGVNELKEKINKCKKNLNAIKGVKVQKIQKESYADKVKSLKSYNESVVMIVPKENQDSTKTKS